MKRAVQIKTVSQWHLLKQLNDYLGKRKIPEEVMRKIYHILCSKKLGKNGFIILCLYKLKDDWYEQSISEPYRQRQWMGDCIC